MAARASLSSNISWLGVRDDALRPTSRSRRSSYGKLRARAVGPAQNSAVCFNAKNYQPNMCSYRFEGRDQPVMSDERTIAKTVGVSLAVVFVAILILSAISY